MRICFASNNKHKLEEVRPLLEPDFSVLSLSEIGCHDDLPETTPTLEGNSLQKAQFVYDHFGIACFADDTGLEVSALNHAPGVLSARYAGEQKNSDDNIRLLLANLAGHDDLSARFRTVITVVGLGPSQFFEGILPGKIIRARRGTAGFGYDPVFQPEGSDKTLAEMSLPEKNKISHRAVAVAKLIRWLKGYMRSDAS